MMDIEITIEENVDPAVKKAVYCVYVTTKK